MLVYRKKRYKSSIGHCWLNTCCSCVYTNNTYIQCVHVSIDKGVFKGGGGGGSGGSNPPPRNFQIFF